MSQQIINIGTDAGAGNGDDLRTAFDKTNQNFTEIYSGNVLAANIAVYSVAGRVGNVEIAVQDVLGAVGEGEITLIRQAMAANSAADRDYTDSAILAVSFDPNNPDITGGTIQNVQIYGTSYASLTNLAVAGATTTNSLSVAQNAVIGGVLTVSGALRFPDNSVLYSANTINGQVNGLLSNAASQSIEIAGLRANIAAANALIGGGPDLSGIGSNVAALQSNAGTQGTQINNLIANAGVQASSINALNANVSTLFSNALSQQTQINSLRANITAANAIIANLNPASLTSVNANVAAANAKITILQGNVSSLESATTSLRANITAANAVISTLSSNVATLIANASAQAITLSQLQSNAATQAVSLNTLNANAATQETEISGLRANIAAANAAINAVGIGSLAAVNANVTAANAAIAQVNANVTAANAAIALRAPVANPTFTGTVTAPSVTAGNVTVSGNVSASNVAATNGRFTNVFGTLQTSAQPNITSVGTLGNLTVSGNVTADTAVALKVYGIIRTSGQPNITSVGNLLGLAVTGNVSTTGNVIAPIGRFTDLIGTLATAAQPNITSVGTLTQLNVGGNLTVTGNFVASNPTATFTSSKINANLTTANYVTVIQNITANTAQFAGNITVPYVLGSIVAPLANVTGNLTSGNSTVRGTLTATNAVIGNITGLIQTSAQPNITSVGTLATLAVTGNVFTGNVSGSTGTFTNIRGALLDASQTNITAIGTLATLNVTGNVSTGNVSGTKGTFTNVQGTVITAAQPNITSVGTLNDLNVTGRLSVTGNAIVSDNFYVTGNLYVGGNTTTVNTEQIVTAEKNIILANNASTATLASGAGVFVGDAGSYANLIYNQNDNGWLTPNSLKVKGSISTDSNITVAQALIFGDGSRQLESANVAVASNLAAITGNIEALFFLANSALESLEGGSFAETNANVAAANAAIVNNANAITIINANVSAANASIVNLYGNAGILSSEISGLRGNITAANVEIDNLRGNITAANVEVANLRANITAANIVISTLTSNAATQSTAIDTVNANITAANLAISGLQSNAAGQSTEINDLRANITAANSAILTKANTDAPTLTGNVLMSGNASVTNTLTVGNITGGYASFSDLALPSSASFTGNISAGNLKTAGQLEVGKIISTANISTTADVQASRGYFTNGVRGQVLDGNQPYINTVGTLVGLTMTGNITGVSWVLASGGATFTEVTGTLKTNAQPNINSVGTLTSLDVSGNIATTANLNVTGNIATGNLASTQIDASLVVANIVKTGNVYSTGNITATGNLSAGNVSGATGVFTNVQGTLLTTAQPNIISVGTLTTLSVTGNASAGNISTTGTTNTGNLVTAGDATVTGNVTAGNIAVGQLSASTISITGSGAVNLGSGSLTAGDVYGNLHATNVDISGTTPSTSTTTGAFTVVGGTGIGGNINIGGIANIGGNANITGTMVVLGNVTMGNANIGGTNGRTYIKSDVVFESDEFLSTQACIALFTTTTTTLNIGLAAQTVNIGSLSGNTTVFNALNVVGNIYGNLGNPTTLTGVGGNLKVDYTTTTANLNASYSNIGNIAVGSVTNPTWAQSTSATTGALQVLGGAGVTGNINVGYGTNANSWLIINNSVNSVNAYSGALQLRGGIGIQGNLNVLSAANISSTVESLSPTTFNTIPSGALRVWGGAGIAKNLNVGGDTYIKGGLIVDGTLTIPTIQQASLNNTPVGNAIPSSGNFTTLGTTALRPRSQTKLNFNFAYMQKLDPRLTFTRNSIGTRVDRSGNLVVMSANQPRFTHDYDGNPMGLIIEESRTNIFTYSSAFDNAAWSPIGSTVATTTVRGPEGSNNGVYFIQEDSNLNQHGFAVTTPTAITSGSSYTVSIFAKSGTRSQITMVFDGEGTASVFDLGTGNVASPGTNYQSSMELYANSWYRCSSTVTKTNTSGNVTISLAAAGSYTYTGDGAKGAFVYGMQLEQGTHPTSYIPTTVSTVTRDNEILTMTGSNFNGVYNTRGTILADAEVGYRLNSALLQNTRNVIVSFDDGTADNRVQLVAENKTAPSLLRGANLQVITGGVFQSNLGNPGNLATGDSGRVSAFYSLNYLGFSLNANAAITDNIANIPSGVTRLVIGSGPGANYLNGTISRIQYWPTVVSTSEIENLSRQ
jgi:predicted  nucleic acid-binding Zn-ribbon protein